MQTISLAISGLSLLVAVVALAVSWRTSKKQLEIETARDRNRFTEKRKANLVAKVIVESHPNISGGTTYKYYLSIRNNGRGEARDVGLILDGRPFTDHEVVPKDTKVVATIGPDSEVRHELRMSFGKKHIPMKVDLTWDDDSDEPGKYSTTLTP